MQGAMDHFWVWSFALLIQIWQVYSPVPQSLHFARTNSKMYLPLHQARWNKGNILHLIFLWCVIEKCNKRTIRSALVRFALTLQKVSVRSTERWNSKQKCAREWEEMMSQTRCVNAVLGLMRQPPPVHLGILCHATMKFFTACREHTHAPCTLLRLNMTVCILYFLHI